jgi:hypothetical protein
MAAMAEQCKYHNFRATMSEMMYYLLLIIASLLPRNSNSLQFPTSRRTFVTKAAASASAIATAVVVAGGGAGEVANAAIDVSGLSVEPLAVTPGQAPTRRGAPPASGLLAGTKLGFQVGGGPRSEEEVRKIDEPRYAAVRKAQGLGPAFLEGVPIESEIKSTR